MAWLHAQMEHRGNSEKDRGGEARVWGEGGPFNSREEKKPKCVYVHISDARCSSFVCVLRVDAVAARP